MNKTQDDNTNEIAEIILTPGKEQSTRQAGLGQPTPVTALQDQGRNKKYIWNQ